RGVVGQRLDGLRRGRGVGNHLLVGGRGDWHDDGKADQPGQPEPPAGADPQPHEPGQSFHSGRVLGRGLARVSAYGWLSHRSEGASLMKSGVRREFMNPQVLPQDDLFEHVNGGWLATTEIPQDKGRYGAFDMLREAAEADVRALIEESAAAAADAEPGSAERQVGDLYASFMDTD